MKVWDPWVSPSNKGQRWKDKKGKAGPSWHLTLPRLFFLLNKVLTPYEALRPLVTRVCLLPRLPSHFTQWPPWNTSFPSQSGEWGWGRGLGPGLSEQPRATWGTGTEPRGPQRRAQPGVEGSGHHGTFSAPRGQHLCARHCAKSLRDRSQDI